MRIAAGFATHTGRVRDNNEDSFVVDERLALFAIADGMGGHRGGEIASKTAVEALRAAIASGRSVDAAVKAANAAVLEKASQDPELTGMGTTMTAVLPIGGATLLIGHVGDSRAYVLRDGTLTRHTQDHSLVEELVREGRLTPEQAESHPQRAIVTRALGVDEEIEVDLYTLEVREGDRVILCSDGLTTMLRDRDVERIARGVDDAQRCAEDLVNAAVEAGGEDNVTVVVLDALEVDEAQPPDPVALAREDQPVTPAPVSAPDVSDTELPSARFAPVQSRRRRWIGVVLVLVPLIAIIVVALVAIRVNDRNNWYLAAERGEVVLYHGRPDALIWDATRDVAPTVRVRSLTAQGRSDVAANISFDSRAGALAYLDGVTTTTTTSSTPPTTRRRTPQRTTVTTRARTARTTATTRP